MNTENVQNQEAPYVLSKFDLVADIMRDCPRAVELLSDYGIHCVSCFANDIDTLEQGAFLHSMTVEELDEMISEINSELEKEWREKHLKKTK
jgi:hybrid cluster-associated redox disulfide protein